MPTVQTVGPYTVSAEDPVCAHTSSGPNDYAWFSGIDKFGGDSVLLRFSDTADANDASAHHRCLVSLDRGATWGIDYAIPGVHTSNEPLAMILDEPRGTVTGAQGIPRGGAPPAGVLRGGSYSQRVQGGLRSLKSDLFEFRNGGIERFIRGDGVSTTGFTRDILVAYRFGSIVQLAPDNWVSVIQIQYVGDSGVFTCECIRSTDQGATWTKIGTVATTSVGGEGFSEPDIIAVPATGELMVISRVGTNGGTPKCARAFSSDGGVTWGAVTRISPYAKAPHIFRIGNGDFICCSGGWTNGGSDTSITGLGMWMESDPHGTWANVWDMLLFHNSRISDPNQKFYTATPAGGCRGYTGICELTRLSNGSELLISYERAAGADGLDATPNRIYVVRVTVTR